MFPACAICFISLYYPHVLQFEEGRLGEPLSQAAKDAHIKQMYGERIAPSVLLAESAAQLDLEAAAQVPQPRGVRPANGLPAPAPPAVRVTPSQILAAPAAPVSAAMRAAPLPLPVNALCLLQSLGLHPKGDA